MERHVGDASKHEIYVSYSSLRTFSDCGQKFHYAHEFRHADQTDQHFALGAGTALHEAIQEYMTSRNEEKAVFALFQRYPHHLLQEGKSHGGRSYEACYAALRRFMNSDLPNRYALATLYGKPATEVDFRIALSPKEAKWQIYYTGHVDFCLQDREDGSFIAVDLKTTRRTDNQLSVYERTDQLLPYSFALAKAQDAKSENYPARYWFLYIDVLNPSIEEEEVNKTQADLIDWMQKMQLIFGYMLAQKEAEFFVKQGENCVKFKQRCPFIDICGTAMSDEDLRDYFSVGLPPAPTSPPTYAIDLEMRFLRHA